MDNADRVIGERLRELQSRRTARDDVSDWEQKRRILIESCHPNQRNFATDTSRLIAALVGGRGGKTTGAKARILLRMLSTPNARVRYFAMTRPHAEDLMWVPLKATCDALEIPAEWNESKLRMTLPRNGATLWLVGCNDKKHAETHRGLPSHEVLIDEAGSFGDRLLDYLIDQVIGPRLGDYLGTLVLFGTPSVQQSGRFFDVTKPGSEAHVRHCDRDKPEHKDWEGWTLHQWSLADGAKHVPEMANAWAMGLKKKELLGWSDENPIWRREYLGEWAQDNTENIYHYAAHKEVDGVMVPWNEWDPPRTGPFQFAELPQGHEWLFVYGSDLGHGDDYAEQVLAYSPTSRDLLHVAEFGGKKMYPKRIAEHLLGDELKPERPTGMLAHTGWPVGHVADSDGLGQGYLDELCDVYGIPIKPADKKNKLGSIEAFNGDLTDGRIKVLKGSRLAEQLTALQWHVDEYGRLKEKPGDKNDFADAALYARREAFHLMGGDVAPPPAPASLLTQDATIRALEEAEARLSGESEDGDDWDAYASDDWTDDYT